MATTVAQHTVATFTSPVNGTTPIDANTVRGNDNTTRVAYNDHDSDPGIHVQSSTLASRPVAGTAGRKWITDDSGIYTLWFDDGTNWHPVSSENVAVTVLAGETLAKGDVVKVTGWNNGQDLAEVVKTTSASDTAFAVMTAAVSSGTMGYATNTGIVQDVNTAAYSVGTILYANGSGGFTSTKPTSGHYQPVAYVLRANASNGVYYVEFSTPRIVERSDNTASTIVLRDSNGDFSAGTITATAVNATTLDLTNLEVTNIKAKDGTQAIAIADVTGVTTFSAVVGATLSTAAQPNITSVGTLSSLTVSGDLTVDTSTLKVDSTNNRVGVGTASPATALQVYDATSATIRATSGASANLDLTATATDVRVGTPNGVSLLFRTSNATVGSFDSAGNLAVDTSTLYVDAANNRVGVGTASPSYRFDVANGGGSAAGIRLSGNDQSNVRLRLDNTGTGGVAWELTGGLTGANNSHFSLYDATAAATRLSVDGSGNLAVDTNTLYVDAANNRVGVGTASPGATLDVNGNGIFTVANAAYATAFNSTSGNLRIVPYVDATQGTSLIAYSAGYAGNGPLSLDGSQLRFYTGGTVKSILDASGNLGLGVTPSAWSGITALQVSNASLRGSTGVAGLGHNVYYDGANFRYQLSTFASDYYQINGTHVWRTAPSGTAGNAITFTQAMTLDASGNLSVGTTSAYGRVTSKVGSGAQSTNVTNVGLSLLDIDYTTSGNISTRLSFVNSNGITNAAIDRVGNPYNDDSGSLAFSTRLTSGALTERARITSGGDLLVGYTSTGTTFGATSGVIRQSGGVWTERTQITVGGSTTTTMFTLANASNNQTYMISARQSGLENNFVLAFVTSYGASAKAVRIVQDNTTGGVLDMNITASGLALQLVLGSGFGSTTWDCVLTRIG